MIVIDRINKMEYSFAKSDVKGIRQVAKALTFPNPSPFGVTKNIEMFDKRSLVFKIGMLKTLCECYDEEFIINDYKYDIPQIEIDDRMDGKYVHQRYAVEHFFQRRFGIIVVPTRGGKTFIASEICRIFLNCFEGNFLFIVDNTTLFTQAVNDFKKFFERYGGIEIGEIRAGKIDVTKRVTVAMIQTLQSILSERCKDRKKRNSVKHFLSELKFLAVDEIHDNCSNSRLKLYKKCKNLDFQLCLSATPYRSNDFLQNLKLKAWSGDIIYTISEEVLRERGVLSDYKVIELLINHAEIDYENVNEDTAYSELRERLIYSSEIRNNCLLKIIEILKEMQLKTLVLFQSISHGDKIAKLTKLPFISGRDKGEDRESAKTEFLNKEGGVLLASEIFKKGVTLPECQVIINVDSGYEASNVIQRKGRVLGTTKDKSKSLVIDFVDLFDSYFSKHSEARLETYIRDIGEERVEILNVSVDGWYEEMKKSIVKWFNKN